MWRADDLLDLSEPDWVAEIYSKSGQKSPIALKARRYVAAGYERLLRYQSESGGFSYWGHGEAPDLALTTYALEFLHHAANVISVDEGVVQAAEKMGPPATDSRRIVARALG